MDPRVLEKMQRYVVLTDNKMAEQKGKCAALKDEVEACRILIESLQFTVREAHLNVQRQREHTGGVSQFSLKQLQSGGQILVIELTKHLAHKGANVFLEQINRV